MCDCACVRAGVMERVGALVPAPALARGVTPDSARSPFLPTVSPASPSAPASARCGVPLSFPIARSFVGSSTAGLGGQVRRRRETPPDWGNPRNGADPVPCKPGRPQQRAEADPRLSDKLLLSWLRRGAITPSPGWPNLLGVPE